MRFRFTFITALLFASVAFAADEKKPAAPTAPPTVTDAQKIQIKDLQNQSLLIDNKMKQMQIDFLSMQEQQKQTSLQLQQIVVSLCPETAGKKYVLNTQLLSCVEPPAATPPAAPPAVTK